MNILNVDEVIANLASLLNYKQLIHLSSINQSYYKINNHYIKNYTYAFDQLVDDFNIKIHLSNYKASLLTPINIDQFVYGNSRIKVYPKSILIFCSDDIDELMAEFNERIENKITEIHRTTSTVTFKMPINNDKYDQLISQSKSFKNSKNIHIHKSIFKIFKNGTVQTTIQKPNDFIDAYKMLITMIKNL